MATQQHRPVTARLVDIDEHTFLERVPVSKMFIAPYGRLISMGQIGRMAKAGYDIRKAGIITLSLRPEGSFAVLDGNHRRHLAIASGITEMLARVFIDLTYPEEAELFVALNTVKPPTALDKFQARIESGEPVAVDIKKRLAEYSLRISTTSRHQSAGTIHSVTTIDKIYQDLGPETFSVILGVIHQSWRLEPGAWTGSIFSGLNYFWARYQDQIIIKDLVLRLSKLLPGQLVAAATASGVAGETPGVRVGQHIQRIYNARRRTNILPEWKARVILAESPQANKDVKQGRITLEQVRLARGYKQEVK